MEITTTKVSSCDTLKEESRHNVVDTDTVNLDELYSPSDTPKSSSLSVAPTRISGDCRTSLYATTSQEVEAEGHKASKRLRDAKSTVSVERCKVYVGGLSAAFNEHHVASHFSNFGNVTHCSIVRDYEGTSKGFGFVTFATAADVENVLNVDQHCILNKVVRVNMARGDNETVQSKKRNKMSCGVSEVSLPGDQRRVFVGPLPDPLLPVEVAQKLSRFGVVVNVVKLRSNETSCKKSYALVDFNHVAAVKRAFVSNLLIAGQPVILALSRLGIELVLSESSVFFDEAHLFCPPTELEKHFSVFGQVFSCIQLPKDVSEDSVRLDSDPFLPIGFVDFVSNHCAQRALLSKSQKIFPGQYIRVHKQLPQRALVQLLAISEKQGENIRSKMERRVPIHGSWGAVRALKSESIATSRVRLPSGALPLIIGERGRRIAEISRDSKTLITVPNNSSEESHVIVEVRGTREAIRTAQYLMQKVIKDRQAQLSS